MASGVAIKNQIQINNRTADALKKIGVISDKAIGEYADDVVMMAKRLLAEKTQGGTGKLESSIRHRKAGLLGVSGAHEVRTDAANSKGYGYGAAQEWGYMAHGRGGKGTGRRVKGKKFVVRAVFGMISRWSKGDRWKA